ncbi:SE1561 family protein [Macrococcus sp. DPC7161]|uniref:SE1561 family protein n=1 Tax=Macrococcus sp. DPC7161 TaxID=2507060 RepID=UPI0013E971D8|nr:SE1561 family protein [Macrococcus sp. DPC7161]
MSKQSLEEIKVKLSDFMETIESVDPETTDINDIDEWLSLLDQLEEKVKSIKN